MSDQLFSAGQLQQLTEVIDHAVDKVLDKKLENLTFSQRQLAQLKSMFEQNNAYMRREMMDAFAHFEKRMDAKMDALETRIGHTIHEIVNEALAPRIEDHEVRIRAVERTLSVA